MSSAGVAAATSNHLKYRTSQKEKKPFNPNGLE